MKLFLTGLRSDVREVLVTSVMDADPIYRHTHPGPSLAPLAMATGLGAGWLRDAIEGLARRGRLRLEAGEAPGGGPAASRTASARVDAERRMTGS